MKSKQDPEAPDSDPEGLASGDEAEALTDVDREKMARQKSAMSPARGDIHSRGTVCHDPHSPVLDVMTYHSPYLLTWRSLSPRAFSVFNRRSLWMTAAKLCTLSLLVSALVACILTDPGAVNVAMFDKVRSFLQVFVGLFLGFFMSASVSRWWSCAEAFLDLFASIRVLQIEMNALGVPQDDMTRVLRYGVSSAWILSLELHVDALPERKKKAGRHHVWNTFCAGEGIDKTFGTLTPDELESIRSTGDASSALFMWIGCYLGYLSDQGIIPPMGSPTYTRFLGLSQRGFDAIREIRSCVCLQSPYIYVQMLAVLVHVNNLVNATSFGVVCGATVATIWQRYATYVHEGKAPSQNATAHSGPGDEAHISVHIQELLVSFIFSVFGPFVYQALLECAIAIAQPFGNEDAVVPTRRLLNMLEKDLHDGFKVATSIYWKQPAFKKQG